MDLRLILLSLLVASSIHAARSLSCYYCINEDGAPDSTAECDEPGPDLLQTCPEGTTQCIAFEGVSSRPTGQSMSGVIRLCGPPKSSYINATAAPPHELPVNKCYCDEEAAGWLKKILPVLAPGDLIVDGDICFCDYDECNNNSTVSACQDNGMSLNKLSFWLLLSVVPLHHFLLIHSF